MTTNEKNVQLRKEKSHVFESVESFARFILETDNPCGQTWARIF